MLFNSNEYILFFLPLTIIVYFYLNKIKLIKVAVGWLVIASLFFYSYWKINYLPLILVSMVFNYTIGYTLSRPTKLNLNRKLILNFGLVGNLGLLCYYKYFDFLINNINFALHTDFDTLKILLPLGISFFTFTQIAYLVDAYKKEVREYDFLSYALFVTYFPHLIAGPILHHSEMMPQFADIRKKVINYKNITMGFFLFTMGLFKKVFLADTFSHYVTFGYSQGTHLSLLEGWIIALSYTFQIYFDFSGYTDMALGAAKMFNINLPINFNSPYKAVSIQDFWRRWHMTLSRFLRDYVYIPLGGNRKGEIKTYVNLFLTFLIGGIWHGASWMFVIWGTLHGIALCINRFWQRFNINIANWINILVTFVFVNITWVFFRAENLFQAKKILSAMFNFTTIEAPKITHLNIYFEGIQKNTYDNLLLFLPLAFIIIFLFKNSNEIIAKLKFNYIIAFCFLILFYFSFIYMNYNQVSEFLYFNF